jgi:hypothetical protein
VLKPNVRCRGGTVLHLVDRVLYAGIGGPPAGGETHQRATLRAEAKAEARQAARAAAGRAKRAAGGKGGKAAAGAAAGGAAEAGLGLGPASGTGIGPEELGRLALGPAAAERAMLRAAVTSGIQSVRQGRQLSQTLFSTLSIEKFGVFSAAEAAAEAEAEAARGGRARMLGSRSEGSLQAAGRAAVQRFPGIQEVDGRLSRANGALRRAVEAVEHYEMPLAPSPFPQR